MSERIKAVLIGAGGWGYQHARILAGRADVDFRAIAGRNPEKTRQRAEAFGVRAYTDIAKMIEAERPDFACVCLPNQEHFHATLQVIRAGVPLLVEKPLVFDLDEADTLLKEAAQRDLFFAINFNHRYARPVQMAKAAIAEGRLGEIVFATWRFGGEGGQSHPHANLIETQCHGFDTLEHLCGPVHSISAEMTDMTAKGFSSMVLALKFQSGAVGSLTGSYDSSYAYQRTHALEINGTKGRVLIDDTVRAFSFQAAGNETAEVWQAGYFNDRERDFHDTFDKHFDAVLEAFRKGLPPPVPASAGRRALQLAHAAIRSFESGMRVKLV